MGIQRWQFPIPMSMLIRSAILQIARRITTYAIIQTMQHVHMKDCMKCIIQKASLQSVGECS